jgi:hypothetical protein
MSRFDVVLEKEFYQKHKNRVANLDANTIPTALETYLGKEKKRSEENFVTFKTRFRSQV